MKRIFLSVVLCLLSLNIYAEEGYTDKWSNQRPSLNASCQLEDGGNLGKGFKGHSTIDIIEAIGNVSQKDQFESDAEYNQRTANVLSGTPSAISQGELCISGAGTISYDANGQVLHFEVYSAYNNLWFDGENIHEIAKISDDFFNIEHSSYTGSNKFGVSVEVSETKQDGYYVIFEKDDFEKINGPSVKFDGYKLVADIPMSGAEARAQKDDIYITYQYELTPPYIGHDTNRKVPTIDSPYRLNEESTYIVGKLKKIAIFNIMTGDIISVFDVER